MNTKEILEISLTETGYDGLVSTYIDYDGNERVNCRCDIENLLHCQDHPCYVSSVDGSCEIPSYPFVAGCKAFQYLADGGMDISSV